MPARQAYFLPTITLNIGQPRGFNLSGENPYSPELIYELEKTVGRTHPTPLMMWNPPFTLALVLPFALLPHPLSRIAWFIASLAVLLGYASFAWKNYGGKQNLRWVPWVFAVSFGPVLHMLKLGQIIPVCLIGLWGFQYFFGKRNYFAAGFFASLTLCKPHLFYLFWLALFFWSLQQRQWRIGVGVGAGLLFTLAIPWFTNPDLVAQYIYAIQNYPPEEFVTATLGSALRLIFGYEHFWLQFLPSAVGAVLFSLYWWFRRKTWSLETDLPLVIIASVATAAYGWVSDLSICLIGLIEVGTVICQRKPTKWLILLSLVYIVFDLVLVFISLPQFLLAWAGLAMLALYMMACWVFFHHPGSSAQLVNTPVGESINTP